MFINASKNGSGGGGGSQFSVPQKVVVPARGTYDISASNVSKVILFVPAVSEMTFWDIDGGGDNYALENQTLITNPTSSQLNQGASYANGTLTIQSYSGVARDVWVTYC